jgi:hypothetical protein
MTQGQQRPWLWIRSLHLVRGQPWICVRRRISMTFACPEQDQLLISITINHVDTNKECPFQGIKLQMIEQHSHAHNVYSQLLQLPITLVSQR